MTRQYGKVAFKTQKVELIRFGIWHGRARMIFMTLVTLANPGIARKVVLASNNEKFDYAPVLYIRKLMRGLFKYLRDSTDYRKKSQFDTSFSVNAKHVSIHYNWGQCRVKFDELPVVRR